MHVLNIYASLFVCMCGWSRCSFIMNWFRDLAQMNIQWTNKNVNSEVEIDFMCTSSHSFHSILNEMMRAGFLDIFWDGDEALPCLVAFECPHLNVTLQSRDDDDEEEESGRERSKKYAFIIIRFNFMRGKSAGARMYVQSHNSLRTAAVCSSWNQVSCVCGSCTCYDVCGAIYSLDSKLTKIEKYLEVRHAMSRSRVTRCFQILEKLIRNAKSSLPCRYFLVQIEWTEIGCGECISCKCEKLGAWNRSMIWPVE